MFEEKLLLHLETLPGRYPDTAIAARALLDWASLIQTTIDAISPGERIALEIVGVTEGSTRFPQILKFLDEQAANVRQAWTEYPHLKSIIAGAAHTFYTSVIAAGVTVALQPSEQTVRLSDTDRALLEPMRAKAAQSPAVQKANRQLYGTLQADSAIQGIGVSQDWKTRPLIIVPRSEFPERSGLWELQEDAPAVRPEHAIWDVVLRRPALISKPQAWEFSRDGFRFSAQMSDAIFLAALKDGRIPLTLQEGVIMRVEVEWKETLNGQVWDMVPRSRRIVRVLSPAPIS